MGNREVIQWASWLVHRYSHAISKTPKTQAPDMAAYLLRSRMSERTLVTEWLSERWWLVVGESQHLVSLWHFCVVAYGLDG